MTDIYVAIKVLKDKVAFLERRFGSLEQYGIADEIENIGI